MGQPKKKTSDPVRRGIESLESRQFLSANCLHAQPDYHAGRPPAPIAPVVQGYTPSQIRHAYGMDQVSGDGSGQTIAIVDAFRHPSIASDLATFDQKFGIGAPPSFKIVGQTGGSDATVKVNSGWASEIALDVEWAHAIAPGANLLLVETKSDNIPDLVAGVDYARKAAGVSVISMSWGTSEWSGQKSYDATFATPASHPGVTFVASSGDEGSTGGAEWPATSANVVSVGGTSLNTTGGNGTYGNESSWSKSTGGVSRYEKAPAYQSAIQGGGFRTSPDVSYNADPNNGFAVYSSVRDGGVTGWSVVGGTSAGAPQWAGQVAVADQLRAALGKTSLNGAAGTLSALYSLYSAPNTAGYSHYAGNFHDITQGRSTGRQRPGAGYDEVTGLGSPVAPPVIYALSHVDESSIAVTKAMAAPKTAHNSAHHSRIVANAENNVDTSTASVAHGAVVGISRVNLSGDLSWADAARWVQPVSATRQFSQVFPAFSDVVRVKWATIESGTPSIGQAAELIPTVATTTAHEVAMSVSAVSAIAENAVPMFLDFGRSNAVATFADAMADFAYESSALGTAVTSTGAHVRAWAVTFAMVGVDVILIGYWRAERKSKCASTRRPPQNQFSLVPVR